MDQDIDKLILSFVETRFLKVAMIMSRVEMALEKQGVNIRPLAVRTRIAALVNAGLLESKGDVARGTAKFGCR